MAIQYGKSSGSYAKRPLWQWIAIYLVAAIIIYGLIYFFFIAGKGGYNTSGNYMVPSYSTTSSTPTPSPTMPDGAPLQNQNPSQNQGQPTYNY